MTILLLSRVNLVSKIFLISPKLNFICTKMCLLMRTVNEKPYQNSGLFIQYMGADKSLARPTSQSILLDSENISFDALLLYIYIYIYIYIYGTNIPPIMIINSIYENKNLLSLYLVSFLVGLRIYQHPGTYFTQYKFYERQSGA
jgi:hypothetical protein